MYLCTDSQTGTQVAVKVLREELGSAVVVERFLREIAFASELDHPRIPKVLDSGAMGQLPFYVMTYVEGESLRERLDRVKQLPVDEAVRILQAVIEPMTYAHRMGIVHRDIKPGNILVSDESVYVLDFGIARAIIASADERLTSTGVAVGTPSYMSPEQALADTDLDARSDIYSLACVAYEMIAGIPPFVGATPQAVMARRFGSPPPPLSETREGIPHHVVAAISKALLRAPADRWQTAREFGDALAAPVSSESVQQVIHQVEGHRKHYGRVIAATLGVAAIGVAAYVAFGRGDNLVRGQRAMAAWDFDRAEQALTAAVKKNPARPEAQMSLAHLLLVKGTPESQWTPYALRAADAKASLGPEARKIIDALLSSRHESHADCSAWREAAGADSESAGNNLAALSYADCLSADRIVVPDDASPTGYRFRSSHQAAAGIYEGILVRNAESGKAYDVILPRLLGLRATEKNSFRVGELAGDEPSLFVAFPSLAGDTLAFDPVKLTDASGSIRARDPAGLDKALEKNIARLRELGLAWVEVSPDNAEAHEALASVLENNGELSGDNGALAHITTAQRLATRASDTTSAGFERSLRLANTRVRLLLKAGQFADAGNLADSILDWPARPVSSAVQKPTDDMLLGLAALAGKRARVMEISNRYAAEYDVRVASGSRRLLPPEVGADAYRLVAYSLFGGARDSVNAITNRISSKLSALVPAGQIADLRAAVLRWPLSLATPEIGPQRLAELGATKDAFGNAVINLAEGKLHKARAFSDSLAALHADNAPGEITMDAVFQEAWLLTAVGDTTGAITLLDKALDGLSKMPANTLREPTVAGSLVRVMILRARLASLAGDRSARERWANAGRALWGHGDVEIKTLVSEDAVGQLNQKR